MIEKYMSPYELERWLEWLCGVKKDQLVKEEKLIDMIKYICSDQGEKRANEYADQTEKSTKKIIETDSNNLEEMVQAARAFVDIQDDFQWSYENACENGDWPGID